MGVLDRKKCDDANETSLKEDKGIEMSTTSITRCTLSIRFVYLPNITISRQGTKMPKDDFSNTTRTTANNETDGLNIVKSMEIKRVASSTQLESCKFLKNCHQKKKKN